MAGVIRSITAIGLSGQIGLNGKVPWHGDPRFEEQTKRDLAEFARQTAGDYLIVGSVTLQEMSATDFDPGNRRLLEFSRKSYNGDPSLYIRECRDYAPDKDIWICGGQKVYELFAPYVEWHHISVIPYDGPADRYYPFHFGGEKASGVVNSFNASEAIPDNYLLLMTNNVPIYFGPAALVPPEKFNTPGSVSWVSPNTYTRISTRAAETGTGVPKHEF